MRIFLSLALLAAAAPLGLAQLSREQKAVDFQQLVALFAKRYAFIEWKRDAVHYDGLNITSWLDRVDKSKDDLEYLEICAEYAAKYQDGHTGFELPSDFVAELGFTVDVYDGKLLIDSVDREKLARETFPFEIGDELVSMGGRGAADVAQDLSRFFGEGNSRTAKRFAAALLTWRPQWMLPRAHEIGDAVEVVIQRRGGAAETYQVPWTKSGEPYLFAGPVPTPSTEVSPSRSARQRTATGRTQPYMRTLRSTQVFRSPRWFSLGMGSLEPVFGMPENFVQRFGSDLYDSFFTGVFDYQGTKIGFIRVPDFEGFYTADLQSEIRYMEEFTSGLIVDVMRNPGGTGCTAESLIRHLSPTGARSLGNSVRVTWDFVQSLVYEKTLAEEYGATEAEIAEIQSMIDASREAYGRSRGFTAPMPVCGMSMDLSAATDRAGRLVAYSKPVMVLIDDRSASAAEMFAAVMQDTGRAMLYGYRTDGAGASVSSFNAGTYSETSASLSQSILVRSRQIAVPDYPEAPYIENIGVRPDKTDDYMTEDNLVNRGKTFVENMLAAMAEYINKSK